MFWSEWNWLYWNTVSKWDNSERSEENETRYVIKE